MSEPEPGGDSPTRLRAQDSPAEGAAMAGAPAGSRDAATARIAPGTQPGATAAPLASVGRLGKYELLDELGRGGMGVVFRALDTELGRTVAVKTLRVGGADGELVERLLREARTAAALDHPGIVRVHDVGVIDGVPFLAMAFVPGRTLEAIASAGTLEFPTRARLVRDIARAVAHAHARGIVHRDLKPANVMVDEDGGVHVLDFGLARSVAEAARITATGQALGTPHYMAPEQIEGDPRQLGPRTDVYALGALLYRLLADAPPYAGGTPVEVFARSLTQHPEPPRRIDPAVPADLETVCLKALAREPERRYADAAGLADELDRWLRGEAIAARPTAWPERLARRLARRKAVSAVLLLAAAAGAWAILATVQQDRLRARVLDSLRARAGEVLDAALSLRRAGLPMKKAEAEHLPRLTAAVEEADRSGLVAPDPAYHLGRLYRALLRWDDASAAQERALAVAPDFAPARYERAVLIARALDERLEDLRAQWSRGEGRRLADRGYLASAASADANRRARPDDESLAADDPGARALTAALAADLAALEGAPGDLDPARIDCLRGLRRLQSARDPADYAAAKELLERALARNPLLEEARQGLARAAWAANDLDAAAAAYDAGIELDRGYVPFWTGRGRVLTGIAVARQHRGEDPEAAYAAAIRDLGTAVELDPVRAGAWRSRASARGEWARWRQDRGLDPGELYAGSIGDYDAALKRDPDSAETLEGQAAALTDWASLREKRGEPADELFARAEADAGRAIELRPDWAEARLRRGQVRANRAYRARTQSSDGIAEYEAALADFDAALECNPTLRVAWYARAVTRLNLASARAGAGADPTPALAAAEADFQKAFALEAPDIRECTTLASLHAARGQWADTHGGDAEPCYAEADTILSRGIEADPRVAEGWRRRANARGERALSRIPRREDPEPLFAQAAADFAKALEIDPEATETRIQRASLHSNWGLYRHLLGGDPEAQYRAALADADEAVRRHPRWIDSWHTRGASRMNWALMLDQQGKDPEPWWAQAIEDFDRGIELAANDARLWTARGQAKLLRAEHRATRGGGSPRDYEEARADFGRALEANPASAEAHWRRGVASCRLGSWAEALRDFEAADRIDPNCVSQYSAFYQEARNRAGKTPPGEVTPPWLVLVRRGHAAIGAGDYAGARARYREGLESFREATRRLSARDQEALIASLREVREELVSTHYNAGCIEAQWSVGRDGPDRPVRPLPAGAAAAARDAAFAHLYWAVALGWADADHLAQDPDLVPLHTDPRWAPLVARTRGGK